MRWFVDIVPLGKGSPERLCVEASHWQPALKLARELRGDGPELVGLSVEFVEDGCRILDPATRLRYTVRPASEEAPLSHKPSKPSGAPPPRGSQRPTASVTQRPPPVMASTPVTKESSPPAPLPLVHAADGPGAPATDLSASAPSGRKSRTLAFESTGAVTVVDDAPAQPSQPRMRTMAFASEGEAKISERPPALDDADVPAATGADHDTTVDSAPRRDLPPGPSSEHDLSDQAIDQLVRDGASPDAPREAQHAAVRTSSGGGPSLSASSDEQVARAMMDETMPSAGTEQTYELLSTRAIEPTTDSPLSYREYVFGLNGPLPADQLERFALHRLVEVRQALADLPPGQVVNIAVFDHVFHGRPARPPVITLSWKDWRTDGPEIALDPYGGGARRAPAARASEVVAPETAAAPVAAERPRTAVAATSSAVVVLPVLEVVQSTHAVVRSDRRPAASAPEAAEPANEDDVPSDRPTVPTAEPPRGGADRAPRSRRSRRSVLTGQAGGAEPAASEAIRPARSSSRGFAPLRGRAPRAAVSVEEAAEQAQREREAAEQARRERAAAEQARREREAAEQAQREREAAEQAQREREAAEKAQREREAAEKAQRERAAAEQVRREREAAEKAQRERAAAKQVRSEREAAEKAQRGPAAVRGKELRVPSELGAAPGSPRSAGSPIERARALVPTPAVSGPRLRGDELLTDLFEAMAELPFFEDLFGGAEYALAQVLERLPCEVGLLSLFDMAHREYVVVRQIGGSRSALLLRMAQRAKLASQAMRYGRAMLVPDAGGWRDSTDSRWSELGVRLKSLLCAPLVLDGRFLGLIELVNPQDRKPFTDADGHALTYVGQQLSEFVAARGIVVDPDEILAGITPDEG